MASEAAIFFCSCGFSTKATVELMIVIVMQSPVEEPLRPDGTRCVDSVRPEGI